MSLSLRRAWIEILTSVSEIEMKKSLSLRRAWIEMHYWKHIGDNRSVALLTESVD